MDLVKIPVVLDQAQYYCRDTWSSLDLVRRLVLLLRIDPMAVKISGDVESLQIWYE